MKKLGKKLQNDVLTIYAYACGCDATCGCDSACGTNTNLTSRIYSTQYGDDYQYMTAP